MKSSTSNPHLSYTNTLATSNNRKILKHLFLLIFISASTQIFAQDPNPDLFQTWYLQRVFYGSPLDYTVSNIEPSIYPYITILENLNFEGQGACNTFDGSYMHSIDEVVAVNFNSTTITCDFPIHNSFEDSYFGFMSDWWYYYIEDDGTGLRLNIYQPAAVFAIFTNYPLSVSENEIMDILVYPNPSSSLIKINSEQNPILTIDIFDILGQHILSKNTDFETVDISNLNDGIYLMKISTTDGATIKKIIKN